MRILPGVLACLSLVSVQAADQNEILATARANSSSYQRHLKELSLRLRGSDDQETLRAIRALADSQDPDAIELLSIYAGEEHPVPLIEATAIALGKTPHPLVGPTLRALTRHSDGDVRSAAYLSMCALGVADVKDHVARFEDPVPTCHLLAVTNLAALQHAPATAALGEALRNHRRPQVRRMAASALARMGDPVAGPWLQEALMDADQGVRSEAAAGIAALRYRHAIPYMLLSLEGVGDGSVYRVLRSMTKKDLKYNPYADTRSRRAAVDAGFSWWVKQGQR